MLNKEYYKLSELKKLGTLTDEDVHYFLERRELPLIFFRLDSLFILGKGDPFSFTGHCYAFYSGLVELDHTLDECFIENNFLEFGYCSLLELDRLDIVESECPTALVPPNMFFKNWESKFEIDINIDSYFAMENLTKTRIETDETLPKDEFVSGHECKNTKLHFSQTLYKYDLNDLIIYNKDLMRLGIIEKQKTSRPPSAASLNVRSKYTEKISLMTDNLDRVLARIITTKNNPSLEVIFRYLITDFEKEDREFDTENILTDVTNNELVYIKHNGEPKTIGKSTVGQHNSRIRKVLGLNKK
ncbi:hypothetical protein [Psychrosphaera haliotis]|uniref:Uncharacterized protein n=1 Tax=Psychrosphaera haliotis TaxID=555083 RepID=A0A6N8FF68_9GAMM|nr:hypothetical protein [Psychrosphaera haliotis]MUH73630.1 hypothetical protein [Psychrosphaera haliotis]